MGATEARAGLAALLRKTKRYPSDLTDEEWGQIAPLMPPASPRGRKRSVDFWEIPNALRYLVHSGCGWEMLPVHFRPLAASLLVVSPSDAPVLVPHGP
mgnify:CR=1 FL=1